MPEKWDLERERAFLKGRCFPIMVNVECMKSKGYKFEHHRPYGAGHFRRVVLGSAIILKFEAKSGEPKEVEITSALVSAIHTGFERLHPTVQEHIAECSPTPGGKVFPVTGGYIEFGEDYIRFYSVGKEEIVGWTQDEWVEDPSVVLSIAHAAAIAAKDGILRLRRRIEYGVKI